MKICLFQNGYNAGCFLLLLSTFCYFTQVSVIIDAMNEFNVRPLPPKKRWCAAEDAYTSALESQGKDASAYVINLKKAASMDHPEACFALGQGYYQKMIDFITAKKSDSQESQENKLHAEIFYNEGIHYFTKQDRQSFKRGEALLKDAAWNGSIQAQKALVQYYHDRALVYFQKAIALGHTSAREELALLERQKAAFNASITRHPFYIQ